MKKNESDPLTKKEITERESRVLNHFLNSKPEPHKPLGKNPQAKRRRKEKVRENDR
jgi:hypothetical protein